MSPRHARAFPMHPRPSPRSIPRRLRQTDRRNRVPGVAWATSAVHCERDRADVGPHPPGAAMFVAGRRRGISAIRRTCEHMRSHAQSLNPLARGYLSTAGCEFSSATVMRALALPSKWRCILDAYGADHPSPAQEGTTYVLDTASQPTGLTTRVRSRTNSLGPLAPTRQESLTLAVVAEIDDNIRVECGTAAFRVVPLPPNRPPREGDEKWEA